MPAGLSRWGDGFGLEFFFFFKYINCRGYIFFGGVDSSSHVCSFIVPSGGDHHWCQDPKTLELWLVTRERWAASSRLMPPMFHLMSAPQAGLDVPQIGQTEAMKSPFKAKRNES